MSKMYSCCPSFPVAIGAESRMWKRFCLLALLLLVAALPLKAAPVSEDSARTVAANVLGTTQLVNRTAELIENFSSVMYLFVPESGVGFALVSADDRALPVLGYSTTSVFDVHLVNTNYVDVRVFFNHYATQVNNIRSSEHVAAPEVTALWEQLLNGPPEATTTAIAPLLATSWNQSADYERLTPLSPNVEGMHMKAGGGALAMAQVMKYWNHPFKGTGSTSYVNYYAPRDTLSANFDTTYYAWDDMPNALDGSSTEAQRAAVNLLIYHASLSLQTRYHDSCGLLEVSGGSGVVNALKNVFHYKTTANVVSIGGSNYTGWTAMLRDELAQSRPIVYVLGRYAFAVDGCDDWGHLHINWGRGGASDGYFVVGSITLNSYTSGAQSAVLGIEPIPSYTVSAEPNDPAWGSVTGGATYFQGTKISLRATPVPGSRFIRWNDGVTANPRTITVNENRNDTAIFQWFGLANVSVESNNPAWGTVSGGAVYYNGDPVTLEATPIVGARFVQWNDGGTDNPRTFVANGDRSDIAEFEYVGIANVSATVNDAERGSVRGVGTYTLGDNVVLTAMPVSGWIFERWNDGSTEATRRFTATEDVSFSAYFIRPGVGDPQFHLVELDDRENHSWSYYSDPECLIRSLNPMDVRIRYFGYGQNTMYSSDALQPEGEPDVDVSHYMVGIGIDAPWKNTYVYHKTLERVNGEQAESMAAADGPAFYRLIPNPYSRRPTHGTGDTRWRGFYKWRLKTLTGGSVYRDTAMTQPVTVGTMLDAEDTVFFMPAAEYGMEVDFEAIWAAAAVYYSIPDLDRATTNYVAGRNAYERNIVVWSCRGCRWQRPDNNIIVKDFTLTAVHPDGTDGESPHLLTDVPYHDNAGGDMLRHNLYTIPNSLTAYPPRFNRNTVGTAVGQQNNNTLFWDREAIKFEYIRFSPSITVQYNVFALRNKAIPDTDTTWKLPFSATKVNIRNIVGDTLRGFKVYNGDTLHAIFYDYHSVFSNCIKAGQLICGRMCIPQDGHNYFGMGSYSALHNTFSSNIFEDSLPKDIRYRLESGRFSNEIFFVYARGNAASPTPVSGKISLDVVIGSDYDRSLGENRNLFLYAFKAGSGLTIKDSINKGTCMFSYVIKSGTFTAQYDKDDFAQDPYTTYIGGYGTNGYKGGRVLTVEGGEIVSIAGGMDPGAQTIDTNFTQVRMYIKGGHVKHAVWGAANYADGVGARRMVFTGGEVNGWIAGGCNGTTTTYGATNGNSYIYFGGNARLQHDTINDDPYYYSSCGNLYGAGSGHRDATGEDALVGRVYNSHIVVADSAYISRNVYGGGNYGYVMRDSSHIQILGGTVKGKVFGGANQQRGKKVGIIMRGGIVEGGIHGGSNILGEVKGPVVIRVESGTVGTPGCPDSLGNVFGCGFGNSTKVRGNVHVHIGRPDAMRPHVDNPIIHSNVYGGGSQGTFNSTGEGMVCVTTYNGRIKKSVYGGGLGSNATITGNTNVNILGTTYVGGNVYGGGNMGKVTGNTLVVIGDDTSSYTLAVQSANTAWGTVSGGGLYQAGTVASISATPASGYRFIWWNDGNTQTPRTVTVVGNATYTAQFEAIPVRTIIVAVADGHSAMGTVSGGGNYREGQAVSISATATPGYRFKQWDDGNTQNPRTVTVVGDAVYTAQFMEDPFNWVDLGLPSRLLWADANLGAESPEQYGDYYAWGETTTKSSYSWNTYKYCRGSMNTLTKYCDISTDGYNGYTDNLTTLQPEDDAATATLGGDARIPTSAEWREMINNTTQTNETLNGVAGRRFTSKTNGNSIFIPFGGHMDGTNLARGGSSAEHWTASYGTFTPSTAEMFFANSSNGSVSNGSRLYGFNIRAVRGGN